MLKMKKILFVDIPGTGTTTFVHHVGNQYPGIVYIDVIPSAISNK